MNLIFPLNEEDDGGDCGSKNLPRPNSARIEKGKPTTFGMELPFTFSFTLSRRINNAGEETAIGRLAFLYVKGRNPISLSPSIRHTLLSDCKRDPVLPAHLLPSSSLSFLSQGRLRSTRGSSFRKKAYLTLDPQPPERGKV